jgi:hypothetical protein
MTENNNTPWYVTQRGELLAESFLLELDPNELRVIRDSDAGFDYVAFFSKADSAPVLIGVHAKATEQEINGGCLFQVAQLKRLQNSNIPILIVVLDVKRNEIYFNWAQDAIQENNKGLLSRRSAIPITLRKATLEEVEKLKQEIIAKFAILKAA